MRTALLASLLFTVLGASAEPAAKPTAPLRARLTDEVIASAVRETLAQDGPKAEPVRSGTALSGDRYRNFSRAVDEATKPSCLGAEALKFQPAKRDTKDWHFEAKELMALPFWATAIVRGKCK